MCLEQYLGNVNLKKKQNLLLVFRTSIDSCFAGPRLFLLVSGTGPPGYFEDCRIGSSLFNLRKDFNYMCHMNVEEWHKMLIYIFVPSEKFCT